MAKLMIQESEGVREFEIVDSEIQIGRELDNALRIPDPSVSRHHAILRQTPVGYEIQDLQSSNGVLLNGTRVQACPIQDGDRITLGQIQITFSNPKPVDVDATMAVQAGLPANPLGTVRITAEDIAKLQATPGGEAVAEVPAPPPPPSAQATVPPSVPLPPPAPPVPPPPVVAAPPVPPPVAVPNAQATPLTPPKHAAPAGAVQYAPGPLKNFLPPVPDDAEPIMNGDVPERGDFVTRLVAYLIDIAPLFVIFIIYLVVPGMLFFIHPTLSIGCGCLLGLLILAIGLATLFFWPWCWITYGATPGKKIMKLRVVPEDDPNGRIDVNMAIMRIIGHFLNFGIGYLLIFGDERKGVQDILSKSIVIKVDR